MQARSDALKNVLIHLMTWLVYIVYEVVVALFIDEARLNFWEISLNFSLYALLFYVNVLGLLPHFFGPRRRYGAYALALLATVGAYLAARYALNEYVVPALNPAMSRPIFSVNRFLIESVWRGVYFLGVSFGYWFAVNSVRVERQKRAQEMRLRTTERSLLDAEMAFLKGQINPHFLFNSLNFLYSQVYPHSESAARSILLLSDIMRYALQEDDANGKVMLDKEIQHLNNYIEINQLRFNNRLQVQFELTGNTRFLMILPLILITFVENCFKHGDLFDAAHPLLIRLHTQDNRLVFTTQNRQRAGPKERASGIGLANTTKRLDIIYPQRYTLTLDNGPLEYRCQLTLDL